MKNYICGTCGVQYPESDAPPAHCVICEDERQYVGLNGQIWTTLDEVQKGHSNKFNVLRPDLTSIVTEPSFGIGQRAHLLQTPHGNILWDCITLIDQATIDQINQMGGLKTIALSHPHYYSTIVEWSHAFGGIPIYIHEADRQWVVRPGPAVQFWSGDIFSPLEGVTLIRCKGHFEGSTVLHWDNLLLVGDTITVVRDRRWVSFMYSYPNLVPLSAAAIQHIVNSVEPFTFDQVYDAFGAIVARDGKAAVKRSAERYIKAINP